MTIREFRQFLASRDIPDDWQLSIVVRGGLGGIGKPIREAHTGFDWDRGKVLLYPEHELQYKSAGRPANPPITNLEF